MSRDVVKPSGAVAILYFLDSTFAASSDSPMNQWVLGVGVPCNRHSKTRSWPKVTGVSFKVVVNLGASAVNSTLTVVSM